MKYTPKKTQKTVFSDQEEVETLEKVDYRDYLGKFNDIIEVS